MLPGSLAHSFDGRCLSATGFGLLIAHRSNVAYQFLESLSAIRAATPNETATPCDRKSVATHALQARCSDLWPHEIFGHQGEMIGIGNDRCHQRQRQRCNRALRRRDTTCLEQLGVKFWRPLQVVNDPRIAGQISIDGFAAGVNRMAFSGDDRISLSADGDVLECRVGLDSGAQHAKRNFDSIFEQFGAQLVRMPLEYLEAHRRHFDEQTRDGGGKQPTTKVRRYTDGQSTVRLRLQITNFFEHPVAFVDDGAGPCEQALTDVGQQSAAQRAIEQRRAEFVLQGFDAVGECGLADAEHACSAAKLAGLGQGYETFELQDIQGDRSVARTVCDRIMLSNDLRIG